MSLSVALLVWGFVRAGESWHALLVAFFYALLFVPVGPLFCVFGSSRTLGASGYLPLSPHLAHACGMAVQAGLPAPPDGADAPADLL